MALLEIQDVSKHFGGLFALKNLSFSVDKAEIIGLIGPNGAGKTTLFNVISGTFRPDGGRVIYRGEDVTGLKPHQLAGKRLTRSFQLTSVFANMTVLQNVMTGCYLRWRTGFCRALLTTPLERRERKEIRERAEEILIHVGLIALKEEMAKTIPYGSKRILSVAVGLASDPEVFLLDEPVTGMNPTEIESMLNVIRKINATRGTTLVVIEHNMRAVMGLCDRIVVLNFGHKIAEGSPQEIRQNSKTIDAYLGSEENESSI